MNHPPAAAFDDAVNDNRTNEADMTTEEISGDNDERVCNTKKDHVDDFGREKFQLQKTYLLPELIERSYACHKCEEY